MEKRIRALVNLDEVSGYSASFLDEAFGGLVRSDVFSDERVLESFDFQSKAPDILRLTGMIVAYVSAVGVGYWIRSKGDTPGHGNGGKRNGEPSELEAIDIAKDFTRFQVDSIRRKARATERTSAGSFWFRFCKGADALW